MGFRDPWLAPCPSISHLLHFDEESVYEVLRHTCGVQRCLVLFDFLSDKVLDAEHVFEERFMRTGQVVHDPGKDVVQLRRRRKDSERKKECGLEQNVDVLERQEKWTPALQHPGLERFLFMKIGGIRYSTHIPWGCWAQFCHF